MLESEEHIPCEGYLVQSIQCARYEQGASQYLAERRCLDDEEAEAWRRHCLGLILDVLLPPNEGAYQTM